MHRLRSIVLFGITSIGLVLAALVAGAPYMTP